MDSIEPLFDWLVRGAPGAKRSPDVLDEVCRRMRAAGVPIDRAEAFVRTLHPHVVGRSFVWRPDAPVEVHEHSYAVVRAPEFAEGPVGLVFQTGEGRRVRLGDGPAPGASAASRVYAERMAAEGFSELVVVPFRFLSGEVHAISIATRAAGGFGDDHVAAFERIVDPLTRIAEILALSRTAANLLDTYVGRGAGERILKGAIQRGDLEPIRAVIWFSDLRGFTNLAASSSPGELIATLNEVFDCQVPAVQAAGGEVLKFMGDGMLAIVPLGEEDAVSDRAVCARALEATREAFAQLDALNARRSQRGAPTVRFGLALHVGEVNYGNIGGAGRLDFTCIGPAVNLAARLEALTGKLEIPVVVSEAFAEASGVPVEALGEHALKGVPGPTRVFQPKIGHGELRPR